MKQQTITELESLARSRGQFQILGFASTVLDLIADWRAMRESLECIAFPPASSDFSARNYETVARSALKALKLKL